MTKTFHKFTDVYSKQMIYVDLSNIIAVRETHDYAAGTPNVGSTGAYISTNPSTQVTYTTLTFSSGCQFNVCEHISEVIAVLEGRDPAPARILFEGK